MCLASPCLAVRKDCSIKTLKNRIHKLVESFIIEVTLFRAMIIKKKSNFVHKDSFHHFMYSHMPNKHTPETAVADKYIQMQSL